MPKIQVLDQDIANKIAAGEVVERPGSVVKELVENALDAGAEHITVEIKNGGITYIRVTDDGCGMNCADARCCFLRHATSKIKDISDLYAIETLGFRGEALAAISAVSRIELITANEDGGTRLVLEGGKELTCEETGAPKGTTIIVEDLFFNTPARMKFLKTDRSEGGFIAALMDRLALSNPQVAFKLIQDGKVTRQSQLRIVRDGIVIMEDKISSLRRFKDDVREVASGYECGIGLEKCMDIQVGDILEAFIMEEVAK